MFFYQDISFTKFYKNAPSVFVSANHTSSGGGQDPMHNSITAWVEVSQGLLKLGGVELYRELVILVELSFMAVN